VCEIVGYVCASVSVCGMCVCVCECVCVCVCVCLCNGQYIWMCYCPLLRKSAGFVKIEDLETL